MAAKKYRLQSNNQYQFVALDDDVNIQFIDYVYETTDKEVADALLKYTDITLSR